MAAKDVRFSDDARQRMFKGVNILANAVKATLGPQGRNAVLDNDRKKVEVLFAYLKRILKLDRLRLRGPGAHDEFLLATTAQNLRRMAKWLCPSPPRPAFGVT